jgi:hypothetical protein
MDVELRSEEVQKEAYIVQYWPENHVNPSGVYRQICPVSAVRRLPILIGGLPSANEVCIAAPDQSYIAMSNKVYNAAAGEAYLATCDFRKKMVKTRLAEEME